MILAIDIGNSNIVIGLFDGTDNLCNVIRLSTNKKGTADEYASLFKNTLDIHSVEISKIKGSIISSVVPPLTKNIESAVKMLISKDPIIVDPGIKTGIDIRIDNPAQLGSDIVANAVGALKLYEKPIIICDMGTATTLSIIDKNSRMLGGIIYPGVRTSLDALSNNAAQLPHISIQIPDKVIGTNTIDSMRSGIVHGTASMLDGMIERMEEELGETATVVVTGGLAESICKKTKHKVIYDATLQLKGLYYIYIMNSK